MQQLEKIFFALIRFEINKTELTEEIKNLITPEILPALFSLAKRHDLAHLIGNALEKNGLLEENPNAKKHFLYERNVAVYRYEQQRYELQQICKTLEEAKIPFIPLKGSVIRNFYSTTWQRTSCDIDILVKSNDVNNAISFLQERLLYKVDGQSDHDVQMVSESGIHFELHFALVETDVKIKNVLDEVWNYLYQTDSYEKSMKEEFFYFYHIAHIAKHVRGGGCGIRPFIDTLIILQKFNLERDVLNSLLSQAGLKRFADVLEKTTKYLLADEGGDDIVLSLKDFALYSGMYGDTTNSTTIQKLKKGSLKYFFQRIFPPFKTMEIRYPVLRKWKILYPFFIVRRWFSLLHKEKREKASFELKANKKVSEEKKQKIAKLFKDLEL